MNEWKGIPANWEITGWTRKTKRVMGHCADAFLFCKRIIQKKIIRHLISFKKYDLKSLLVIHLLM
jgi:hypothetical protein